MQTVTLLSKESVAEGTMLFRFSKPAGFEYRAGQSVDLTISEGLMHPYSLVSAPHEDWIGFATRMRDTAFKRALKEMAVGAEVQVDGPFGSFFLHDNAARPAVILSGGIGITPFYSMAKDAAERALPHSIYLFSSDRRPEDAPFQTELQALTTKNSKFNYIPTMTEMEKSVLPWTGGQGYITATLIHAHVPADTLPIYYLAGPQAMVTAMRNLLTTMQVSNDDVRFEEFSGY